MKNFFKYEYFGEVFTLMEFHHSLIKSHYNCHISWFYSNYSNTGEIYSWSSTTRFTYGPKEPGLSALFVYSAHIPSIHRSVLFVSVYFEMLRATNCCVLYSHNRGTQHKHSIRWKVVIEPQIKSSNSSFEYRVVYFLRLKSGRILWHVNYLIIQYCAIEKWNAHKILIL